MKAGSIVCAAAIVTCMLGIVSASGQQTPPKASPPAAATQKPLMAEQVFKNVQVLKGIPVDEFMGTMGFFAASLSLNCTDCHVKAANDDWARYADDTPLKETARKMVLMVRSLNQNSFGGTQTITCYSCHRSNNRPKDIPSLTEQYGTPTEDPNDVESHGQALSRNAPTTDQILDRYINAVGGAQNLAKLTSFVAKGTYSGFDTSDDKVPVEVYAKAPDQRTTILHVACGRRRDERRNDNVRWPFRLDQCREYIGSVADLDGRKSRRRQGRCGSVFSRRHQDDAHQLARRFPGDPHWRS